jgi:hypothetical protein
MTILLLTLSSLSSSLRDRSSQRGAFSSGVNRRLMAGNSESPATKGGRKTISRNSVLPICALLISAVACAASLYQLRMAMSSISAQTWPYVTIGWRHTNDETGIVVDNDGLGPAIIRYVVV